MRLPFYPTIRLKVFAGLSFPEVFSLLFLSASCLCNSTISGGFGKAVSEVGFGRLYQLSIGAQQINPKLSCLRRQYYFSRFCGLIGSPSAGFNWAHSCSCIQLAVNWDGKYKLALFICLVFGAGCWLWCLSSPH